MSSGFYIWSSTAATNGTIDTSINAAEGMAPSAVNDSIRAQMAALAKYRDDISGALVTGGSSVAYTVTTNQVFDTLSHLNGGVVAFSPHVTNGATVTLNVDGLGAKPLRLSPSGDELAAGTLISGTPYVALYNSTNAEFYLRGMTGALYNIPIGGFLGYLGTTAPNSRFVLPFGQALNRTTYSTLFTLVSTTFGNGDGSTTFNILDLRGRLAAGKDDMGGSAAGRLTQIAGSTLGAVGGADSVTLSTAQLPSHNHTQVAQSPTFTVSRQTGNISGGATAYVDSVAATGLANSITTASTASPGSTSSTGSGTAITILPPMQVTNYIVRVL